MRLVYMSVHEEDNVFVIAFMIAKLLVIEFEMGEIAVIEVCSWEGSGVDIGRIAAGVLEGDKTLAVDDAWGIVVGDKYPGNLYWPGWAGRDGIDWPEGWPD